MNKFISTITLCTTFLFASCESQWDQILDKEEVDKENLVYVEEGLASYLQSESKYKLFTDLLTETGLLQELEKEVQYTVWIPEEEELLKLTSLSDSMKRIKVAHHINKMRYFNSDLKQVDKLQLLSNKSIDIIKSNEKIKIGISTIKDQQIVCKNGIIHLVDSLVRPLPNLNNVLTEDEKFTELYQLFKTFDRYVFKPELSEQIGIDDQGNVLYDSVFIWENQVLKQANLGDENSEYTLFLPTNEVVSSCLNQVYSDYISVNGKNPSREDSLLYKKWIAEAIIHDGLIHNYGAVENLYSRFENLWKTSVQKVNKQGVKCSNGMYYEVTSMKVPSLLLMQPIKNYINDLVVSFAPAKFHSFLQRRVNNGGKTGTNNDQVKKVVGGIELFQYRGHGGKTNNIPDKDYSVSVLWNTCKKVMSSSGKVDSLVHTSLIPGEYIVKGSWVRASTYITLDFDVFINQIHAGKVTGVKSQKVNQFYNFTLGTVTIPESAGTAPAEICFTTSPTGPTGTNQLIAPFHIELIPTENNY